MNKNIRIIEITNCGMCDYFCPGNKIPDDSECGHEDNIGDKKIDHTEYILDSCPLPTKNDYLESNFNIDE